MCYFIVSSSDLIEVVKTVLLEKNFPNPPSNLNNVWLSIKILEMDETLKHSVYNVLIGNYHVKKL